MSTTDVILDMIEESINTKGSKKHTVGYLLVLKKAFDTVDH